MENTTVRKHGVRNILTVVVVLAAVIGVYVSFFVTVECTTSYSEIQVPGERRVVRVPFVVETNLATCLLSSSP